MKAIIRKLLTYKEHKHNTSAKEIFDLAEEILKKENLTEVEFFEFCLDVSIIVGKEDYPRIFDDNLNKEFWNILDHLGEA